MGSHSSEQFLPLKWLSDVIDRTSRQSFYSHVHFVRCGNEDHRNTPGLVSSLEPAAHFKSIEARHTNVQEDEFRQPRGNRDERQLAAIRRADVIAFRREDACK